MTTEQERALQASEGMDVNQSSLPGRENEITKATNKGFFADDNQMLPAEQTGEEVTNNDGSISETLDTAFHNQPGAIKNHSIAGSNRADYYEAESQGKSDAEEELDFLKNQQPE